MEVMVSGRMVDVGSLRILIVEMGSGRDQTNGEGRQEGRERGEFASNFKGEIEWVSKILSLSLSLSHTHTHTHTHTNHHEYEQVNMNSTN